MRRLLALLILGALVAAVLYQWRFRTADVPAAARDKAQEVGQTLGQLGESVSEKLRGTKLTGTVKAALELNRTLAALPIDVDAGEGGVVVLKGRAPSDEVRLTAERVAAGVPGVTRVDNQIQVDPGLAPAKGDGRTLGESFDDRALEAKVKLAYSLNRGMEGADISVSAFRREVTLTGRVASEAQHQLALQITREIPHVAAVRDQITVGGPAPVAQAPAAGAAAPGAPAPDLAARAQAAERALLANPSLAPFVLKVRAEGGRLVLQGRVRTNAEKDLAAVLAKDAAGTAVTNNVTVQP